VSIGHPLYFKS